MTKNNLVEVDKLRDIEWRELEDGSFIHQTPIGVPDILIKRSISPLSRGDWEIRFGKQLIKSSTPPSYIVNSIKKKRIDAFKEWYNFI